MLATERFVVEIDDIAREQVCNLFDLLSLNILLLLNDVHISIGFNC
jgi:hypothetical protein